MERKLALRWVAHVALLMLFTGCLKVEQTVTIKANGSGTQELKLLIPERVLEELEVKARALSPSADKRDMRAIFDRKFVERELKAQGLKLHKHEVQQRRQWRRAHILASFDKTSQLNLSSLGGGRADWDFYKGKIHGTVHLVYYPRGRREHARCAALVKKALANPKDPKMVQFFERSKADLRDLDIDLTVNLPGTVLFTDGLFKETGAKQVRARIRGTDIKNISDLLKAMAPRFEVVFDGRGCKLPLKERKKGKRHARPAAAPRSRPAKR